MKKKGLGGCRQPGAAERLRTNIRRDIRTVLFLTDNNAWTWSKRRIKARCGLRRVTRYWDDLQFCYLEKKLFHKCH